MLIRILILCCFLSAGLFLSASGQEVLWATKLLGFSSEYRPGSYGQQYRAVQLLGAPDKLPNTGESPCAWSPADPTSTSEEWVKVGFAKSIQVKQVFIGENANPGALVAVYLYDTEGKEYIVAGPAQLKRGFEAGRMLTLRPQLPENRAINAVKVVMNPSLVPGRNQIDAIGISDSDASLKLDVEVSDDMPDKLARQLLSAAVNSKWRENAPVISPDGATLYFTREHPDNIGGAARQDVWVSTKQANGDWGPARNLGGPVNNAGDNAVLGISGSGKTLYLLNSYRPDGSMVEGFSRSHLGKSGWSFPVAFFIDDLYNDFQPKNTEMTIAPTETVIVLSVQRRDTYGSKDLYVCFKKADGTWTAPANMGAVLNTTDYEGTPFLAADNKTLYFTSLGHRGFGSGDIFVSRRLDDTWLNWSKPLNLGPVINSPGWDSFFTIPASGEYAYMSSFNPASQSDDLYRIPLYPSISPEMLMTLSGKLTNHETGLPIDGKITLAGTDSKRALPEVTVDPETGEFKAMVPFGSPLILSVSSSGFFGHSEELRFTASPNTQTIKNIALFPIRSGQRLPLNQVQFAQSSAVLDKSSLVQLRDLAGLMKQYASMEIMLEGHTDNQGDFRKNVLLSEERVKSVKQFLLAEGVAENRIQLKAWGPSRPVANNLTEESRRLNRRVELTVLKM